MMKINSRELSGSTLIEVLISMLILTIVLTGGMQYFIVTSKVMVLARHKEMAMEMANGALEEMRKAGFDHLPLATGLWGPDSSITFGDFTATTKRRVTNINNVGQVVRRQVEVQVNWNESGQGAPREISLFTYVVKL